MGKYTKEDIIRMVEAEDINFIRLQFTDIVGTLKSVSITRSQLKKALNNQCMFDGSSIEGFVRIEESDMYLYPDPDSFVIFPWTSGRGRVARLICDVYTAAGEPFGGDPRYVLKKILAKAKAMGYYFDVGPECEFFLFAKDEKGRPTTITNDEGGYFDLGPVDLGEDARLEICTHLEDMGFEIETSHHEVAQGQHEIDFRYGEALSAADNIMTFKLAVKTVSSFHGLHATFMPKPIYDAAGSGMHINMSLRDEQGNNVFCDPKDVNGLSTVAYQFIAGLLRHVEGMTAVTNPLVNSYKRLVPGYEAPCYIAWSAQNRSPLIRIPACDGHSTRIELRNPDPSANPYLVLALCLSAGLEGIEQQLTPPESTCANIYDLTDEELETLQLRRLPTNLSNAVDAMRRDPLVKDTLGKHVYDKYVEFKRQEWKDYKLRVTPWELKEYLFKY